MLPFSSSFPLWQNFILFSCDRTSKIILWEYFIIFSFFFVARSSITHNYFFIFLLFSIQHVFLYVVSLFHFSASSFITVSHNLYAFTCFSFFFMRLHYFVSIYLSLLFFLLFLPAIFLLFFYVYSSRMFLSLSLFPSLWFFSLVPFPFIRWNGPLLLGLRRNYRVLRFASGLPRWCWAYRWSPRDRDPRNGFLCFILLPFTSVIKATRSFLSLPNNAFPTSSSF